jgi:hypothetical protein
MLEITSIEEFKARRAEVIGQVRAEARSVVRGLFPRDELREYIPKVYGAVNSNDSRLPSGGVAPEQIRDNVTKWSIGGHSTTQTGLVRFMLSVYNPLFAPDVFSLHSVFRRIIEIRDVLAGRELLTDEKLEPNGWNGCRLQIYPAGGGFLGAHRDTRGLSNMQATELNPDDFIQLVVLLTERGTDYQTGGAFNITDGETIDVEKDTQTGDVLVYDGATIHGVADIDSDVPFRADDLRGRAVLLGTIFDKG